MDFDLWRKNLAHLCAFGKIVQFVVSSNSHLLTDNEKQIVETVILDLSDDARCLFVRMFDRNYEESKELRPNKIQRYVGEEHFQPACDELVEKNLVAKIDDQDLPTMLKALTVEELKEIIRTRFKSVGIVGRKDELVNVICIEVEKSTRQTTFGQERMASELKKAITKIHGGKFTVSAVAMSTFTKIYQIYYFDRYSDASTAFGCLYLSQINRRQYFKYQLSCDSLFQTLEEFENYQEAVAEDVFWGEENKFVRQACSSILPRLKETLANVRAAVQAINSDNGPEVKISANYVWMKVAVRIGAQTYAALGKGDDVKIRMLQHELLSLYCNQRTYAQQKYIPALSSKIALELALFKSLNEPNWMADAKSDVAKVLEHISSSQRCLVDPDLIELDKKLKNYQREMNKLHKSWLRVRDHESLEGPSPPIAEEMVNIAPVAQNLDTVEEYVLVAEVKVNSPVSETPLVEKKSKELKQKTVHEFFKTRAVEIPVPKPVQVSHTVNMISDDDDDDDDDLEVLDICDVSSTSNSPQTPPTEDTTPIKVEVSTVETRTVEAFKVETTTEETFTSTVVQPPVPVPENTAPPKTYGPTLWASKDGGTEIRVEMAAIEHYREKYVCGETTGGWRGWHDEGKCLRTIYSMLFFDIIFMEGIPGVFYNHTQSAPLDFHSSRFYERRRSAIDARLDELKRAGFIESKLRDIYACLMCLAPPRSRQNAGLFVAGISLGFLSLPDILLIARGLGPIAVHGICDILSKNYAKFNSGMPDLCLVHEELGLCKLVEVKSKTDTLSGTQSVWIHHFKRLGVDVEIAKVLSPKQHADYLLNKEKRELKLKRKLEKSATLPPKQRRRRTKA